MKKKLLSVFLAMVMVLTLVTPLTATADETPDLEISTPEGLLAFATAAQTNAYAGKLIVLTDDIDMDGVSDFAGIGANSTAGTFAGTFDGKGHKISNLSWTMTGVTNGFFRRAGNGAEIRNLTLENYTETSASGTADLRHGLLLGSHSAGALTVSNVHIVKGSYTNTHANGASNIGGIVGASMNMLTIENCSVDADIIIENASGTNANQAVVSGKTVNSITAPLGVGGIIGRTNGNYVRTISGCSFTGTISAGRCVGGIFGKGGIITDPTVISDNPMQVTNCAVDATINGAHEAVGGIGGYGTQVVVSGCSFTGAINANLTGARNNAGGILGIASVADISDCVFDGDLTGLGGPAVIGGIVGQASSGTVTLARCETFGTVHTAGNQAGGLVGASYNADNVATPNVLTMTDCFSSADVVAYGQLGALMGRPANNFTTTATNCVALRCHTTAGTAQNLLFAAKANGTQSATNCIWAVNLVADDTNVGAQTYNVTTAQQLYAIARMSKWTTFKSSTFELKNDIELNAAGVNAAGNSGNDSALTVWPMIGQEDALGANEAAPYFLGTFEGNGHTVSGAYVPTHNEIGAGFFALVGSGSTIQNFTLADSYFHTENSVSNVSRIGAVVGDIKASATVSGVTVSSDVTVSGVNPQVGGIVGCAEDTATITDCAFNGAVSSTSGYVGGILGCNIIAGTTTITDCSFGGSVQGTERVGGIVGNCAMPVNITNAGSTGTVTGTMASGWARTGGVIGFVAAAATINGLTDSAAVIAPNGGYDVGGVVGTQNQALTITNADVTATVTVYTADNSNILGGMIGAIRLAYTGTVTNSRFGGTVKRISEEGGTPYIGGVVGTIVNSTGKLAVSHFLMDGNVIATKNAYVGGVAGATAQSGAVEISDTLVTGTVTAPGGQVGAFLGLTDKEASAHLTGSIANSYALDTVCTVAGETIDRLFGKSEHEITFDGEVVALTAAQLTGANACRNAFALDYADYWAAMEGDTPQLKSFKTGTVADTSNLLTRTGATAPENIPEEKVFGGWYADAEFTTPVTSDYIGLAFAKFVDENVLSVKSQKGLNKTSDDKTRLRVVTSVDSMDYNEVGFRITYNNASGEEKNDTARTTSAYATLVGYPDPSTSVFYEPTVFSAESYRFIAFRLVASDAVVAQNPDGISVQPYWITADGVTVVGKTSSGIKFN